MATKRPTRGAPAKTVTTTVTTEPAAEGDAPSSPSVEEVMQQQANDSLVALMAELGSIDGSRCTVHRAEKNQPLEYVFACSPSEFSLDDLRDKYGGGTFRLFVTKPGHTGVWRNMLVHVARTTPNAAASDPNAAMLSVIREGFARQAEVLKAALTPAVPASEPVTMAMLLPQLPALITAGAAAIAALRPPSPPPAPQQRNDDGRAIDLFIRGVELAKDFNGGGGEGEGGLMGILRELVKSPMMAAAVQSMAQPAQPQPQRPALPRPAAPAPTPVAPTPPAPTPEAQVTNQPNAVLAYYLGMLCTMSQNGKDPSLYADLVLDNAPDELLEQLLAAEDGVAYLAQFQPQVEQHRQWFAQLIGIVRTAMNDTSVESGGQVDGSGAGVIQGADATVNPSPERTG